MWVTSDLGAAQAFKDQVLLSLTKEPVLPMRGAPILVSGIVVGGVGAGGPGGGGVGWMYFNVHQGYRVLTHRHMAMSFHGQ